MLHTIKLKNGPELTPFSLFFFFFSQLICYCVESCVQKHIQAQVPEMLEPGYVVSHGTVFSDCLSSTSH